MIKKCYQCGKELSESSETWFCNDDCKNTWNIERERNNGKEDKIERIKRRCRERALELSREKKEFKPDAYKLFASENSLLKGGVKDDNK